MLIFANTYIIINEKEWEIVGVERAGFFCQQETYECMLEYAKFPVSAQNITNNEQQILYDGEDSLHVVVIYLGFGL